MFRAILRSIPILPLSPELYDLITDLRQSRESIDVKIDEASDSLKRTADLIDEIEENLQSRTQKLHVLREELERYSALAEVEEGKAQAIVQQIELAANSGKAKERWISFLINIGAGLLLGLILSPTITQIFQPSEQAPTEAPPVEQAPGT